MSKDDKIDPLALVAKLANEEKRLQEKIFLAPVVEGGSVRVRVAGIVYELDVEGEFEGFAMLRVTEPGKARVVEEASPALVGKYLKLFPRIRLVLLQQFDKRWWSLAASNADTRIQLNAPVPVQLVGSAGKFDTVYARFDGTTFWYEGHDRRRDPAVAKTLVSELESAVKPDQLRCPNAVPQERLAYRMLWLAEHGDDAIIQADDMTRINAALKHAGAHLDTFWYQENDQATVRFSVDGESHSVTIRPSDLSVLSAGICLEGRDADFDLSSLVGVLREARDQY